MGMNTYIMKFKTPKIPEKIKVRSTMEKEFHRDESFSSHTLVAYNKHQIKFTCKYTIRILAIPIFNTKLQLFSSCTLAEFTFSLLCFKSHLSGCFWKVKFIICFLLITGNHMLALLNDLTLVSDQTPSTFLFSNVFLSLLFSFNSLEVSVPNFQTHMIKIPVSCF